MVTEIRNQGIDKVNSEGPRCSDFDTMEIESTECGMSNLSNEIGRGADVGPLSSEKCDAGCHGNVIFSKEAPIVVKDDLNISTASCSVEKLKCKLAASVNESGRNERKLSRQDRIELGRLFQGAVSSHDWELAESLILLGDPQTLNDALCISLDSIWFLSSKPEMYGITRMIEKIIANGAYDFTRAALRTSFLASCVSACQSRTMSLAETVTVMSERY